MNILEIVNALRTEKDEGNAMADEMIERLDAQIRDLETTKAWILNNAAVRNAALCRMLGETETAWVPAVTETVEGEAA